MCPGAERPDCSLQQTKDVSPLRQQPFEPPRRQRVEHTHRIVRDEEGRLWRVREVTYADAAPSLIFESEGVFRRVRRYPRDWDELGDGQLYELSWKT